MSKTYKTKNKYKSFEKTKMKGFDKKDKKFDGKRYTNIRPSDLLNEDSYP